MSFEKLILALTVITAMLLPRAAVPCSMMPFGPPDAVYPTGVAAADTTVVIVAIDSGEFDLGYNLYRGDARTDTDLEPVAVERLTLERWLPRHPQIVVILTPTADLMPGLHSLEIVYPSPEYNPPEIHVFNVVAADPLPLDPPLDVLWYDQTHTYVVDYPSACLFGPYQRTALVTVLPADSAGSHEMVWYEVVLEDSSGSTAATEAIYNEYPYNEGLDPTEELSRQIRIHPDFDLACIEVTGVDLRGERSDTVRLCHPDKCIVSDANYAYDINWDAVPGCDDVGDDVVDSHPDHPPDVGPSDTDADADPRDTGSLDSALVDAEDDFDGGIPDAGDDAALVDTEDDLDVGIPDAGDDATLVDAEDDLDAEIRDTDDDAALVDTGSGRDLETEDSTTDSGAVDGSGTGQTDVDGDQASVTSDDTAESQHDIEISEEQRRSEDRPKDSGCSTVPRDSGHSLILFLLLVVVLRACPSLKPGSRAQSSYRTRLFDRNPPSSAAMCGSRPESSSPDLPATHPTRRKSTPPGGSKRLKSAIPVVVYAAGRHSYR